MEAHLQEHEVVILEVQEVEVLLELVQEVQVTHLAHLQVKAILVVLV